MRGNPADFTATAIVAAAGSGRRLGYNKPKAFVELGGRMLLERCLDGLADSGVINRAIVLVSAEMRHLAESIARSEDNKRRWSGMHIIIGLGGTDRAESVRAGLDIEYGQPNTSLVAVHDAARCLTPPELIRRLVHDAGEAVASKNAAGTIPVLPVADTVKVVTADGRVKSTPTRTSLRAAQTPQVFSFAQLYSANTKAARAEEEADAVAGELPVVTDDSSLMEYYGFDVRTMTGDERALKITTHSDFVLAQALLAEAASADSANEQSKQPGTGQDNE